MSDLEHDQTPIIDEIASRLKSGAPEIKLSREVARQLLNEIDSYHSRMYKIMEMKLRECRAAMHKAGL